MPDEDLLGTVTAWAAGLRHDDVPPRVRAFARSQIVSCLAAVRATLAHPLGHGLVHAFGPLTHPDPARRSQLLAALSIALEYDEVGYSGHPSASAVSVAVAHAGSAGLDGRALLTAVVAADECALRYQASTLLGGFFRGQSATYTHLLGSVAAWSHVTGASADRWAAAARLAFGILPRPVSTAFLTGDAKAFVAATPVRMGLDACAAAAGGLTGAPGVLEGPDGVLAMLSDVPMPDAMTEGLGARWHTETLSFKRFPASAYLQTPFECAERLVAEHGPFTVDDVAEVLVEGSVLTWWLAAKSEPHLAGPDTATSALTFSPGYGIATLLLTGGYTSDDLLPAAVADPDRWALAGRVRVEHDLDITKRMMLATVPLGEVLRQAGPRALELPAIAAFGDDAQAVLDELGGPSPTFAEATMAIGAKLTVVCRDGRRPAVELTAGTGMAGPATRATHEEIAAAKFLRHGGGEDELKALSRLEELDATELDDVLARCLADAS